MRFLAITASVFAVCACVVALVAYLPDALRAWVRWWVWLSGGESWFVVGVSSPIILLFAAWVGLVITVKK